MKKVINLVNSVNSQLVKSVEKYDSLSDEVYKLMHLNKQKHNLWIVVKQQQLTILTDNPYLGTQLRYQQQTICNELNRRFLLELKKTKVKIVPPKAKKEVEIEERFVISEKASNVIRNIAEEIEDKELRDSLIQLTKRE